MKGIVLNRLNESKIELRDLELDHLKNDQVLVGIRAAALNHRDEWCRQGLYPNLMDGVVLGSDGAGVVLKAGSSNLEKWLGKEVIINPALYWGANQKVQDKNFQILGMPSHGTLAEMLVVAVDRLHEKPTFLSWEEAAALPLAGLTAYRALMTQGELKKGEKVLVTGFGGGVAQFAAQFALAAGAEVFVSSSKPDNIEAAMKLGAKAGFLYTDDSWPTQALSSSGGFDLIIDSAMGDTLNQLIDVVKPGGRIVFYGATKGNPKVFNARKVFWNQIKIVGSTMGSDYDFDSMLAFVEANKIRPVIDGVFDLKSAEQAFERMRLGNQRGKIVVKI